MPKSKTKFSKKAGRKLKSAIAKAAKLQQMELVLRDTDVICGRGTGITSWWGNVLFRYLCYKVKPLYIRANRNIKADFAMTLVEEMAKLDPPGRFVELIEGTLIDDRRVVLVPPLQAIEKTCQALREKKNGCPRQFRSIKESNLMGPLFTKPHLQELRKRLELKFSKDLEPMTKKEIAAAMGAEETDDDERELQNGKESKSTGKRNGQPTVAKKASTRPARLTARQAIIESIKEAKDPSYKRKEPEADVEAGQEPSTPPRPTKKPKVCHPLPPKMLPKMVMPSLPTSIGHVVAVDLIKMQPLERSIMNSIESSKAVESLLATTLKASSMARSDSSMMISKMPITMTSSARVLKAPITSTSAATYMKSPPQKANSFLSSWMPSGSINSSETMKPIDRKTTVPPTTTTKALLSDALDFQDKSSSAAYLDQEMALLPPAMTAFCSGIFTNMVSPAATLDVPSPRRYPAKTPRRSHNMLPLEFPSVQPITFDEDDTPLARPDPTTLRPFITQGIDDSGTARSEDAVPMTELASYLSDFFDKKYFPVNTTSQYFKGPDCRVAPLQQPNPSGQSPTTVFDDFFGGDFDIVSYNQALFDDDVEDKLEPMEAFPDTF